ncbi:hypothetical protein [Bacillus pseudomycoides]|uniref:hypothetical protein n=1 Tax=Bacillus pseudomycoides TaxID=64104 RepID=UPI0020D27F67|nr:hypothetical protein [Bacillus pseudomycoides]
MKYSSVSTYEEFQTMQSSLLRKYEKVKEFIQQHSNDLKQVAPKASYDVNLLEKLIKVRIDTLKTYIPNQVKEELSIPPQPVFSDFSYYSHDKQMGHNYHIRKQNAKMLKADPYPIPFPNMMDVMPIIGLHWGQKKEIMIPNQQYDGILWLEHITPSQIK